ncbi:MAG: hypothetical protein HDS50_03360 [Bacteroides sp.]|nr:hypothetical protein [Bacteroides sp.]
MRPSLLTVVSPKLLYIRWAHLPILDAMRHRMGFSTTSASPTRASDRQDVTITVMLLRR